MLSFQYRELLGITYPTRGPEALKMKSKLPQRHLSREQLAEKATGAYHRALDRLPQIRHQAGPYTRIYARVTPSKTQQLQRARLSMAALRARRHR